MTRRDLLRTASALAASNLLGATAFQNPGESKPRFTRGVSFYSYQEEYYKHEMNLEDCFAELASMRASGVQLIAEEMVPNYPNPPEAWVEHWKSMMDRYHTKPTNIDTFVDVSVGGHRNMSLQEAADVLIGQVKLAQRLGFKVVRPTTGPVEKPATDLVERALPAAEKCDVRIAPEVHAPIPLRGEYIDSYLELIHKTGTKHAGFTVDCGIFCKRIPRVFTSYWSRHGVQERVLDHTSKAYEDGTPHNQVVAAIEKIKASPADMQCTMMAGGYGPVTNQVQDLKPLIPYIHNIHGKFYEMTEELHEYSIPYEEIIRALAEYGYDRSIDSEFEGQRWTQDVTVTDSCEQVRRQHVMFRRLFGEIS
jgi:sugar phosphate isomerase/epimerase